MWGVGNSERMFTENQIDELDVHCTPNELHHSVQRSMSLGNEVNFSLTSFED